MNDAGFWLDAAELFSRRSKDPSTRCGAVAVSPAGILLSGGWNGFPRGMRDDERLDDREVKLDFMVHAELNCILNASRVGASLLGATMYVHGLQPCHRCAVAIVQAGIAHVRFRSPVTKADWAASFEKSRVVFDECGVSYA